MCLGLCVGAGIAWEDEEHAERGSNERGVGWEWWFTWSLLSKYMGFRNEKAKSIGLIYQIETKFPRL